MMPPSYYADVDVDAASLPPPLPLAATLSFQLMQQETFILYYWLAVEQIFLLLLPL